MFFSIIYSFVAARVLGLRCCEFAFSSCSRPGLSPVAARRLPPRCSGFSSLNLWAQGWRLPGLQDTGSGVVVCGLSCSLACTIFLTQGSNLCLLHWQMDSFPLNHQGSHDLLNKVRPAYVFTLPTGHTCIERLC